MKQPGLGKKVSELRLEKGMTQSELAEKCNISLRTVQRIEAAEVTPRSYTLKVIFSALNYPFYASTHDDAMLTENVRDSLHIRLKNFTKDLFNLKTNTMKKVTILSLLFFAITFGISATLSSAYAQSESQVKCLIENNNKEYIKWFNSGNIQSLASLYDNDACIISKGCGKEFITGYFTENAAMYKILEMKTSTVSVSNNLAVEKGLWKIQMKTGEKVSGEYLVEWKLADKKWLIMSESTEITSLDGYLTAK